jgi:hypothetical protein
MLRNDINRTLLRWSGATIVAEDTVALEWRLNMVAPLRPAPTSLETMLLECFVPPRGRLRSVTPEYICPFLASCTSPSRLSTHYGSNVRNLHRRAQAALSWLEYLPPIASWHRRRYSRSRERVRGHPRQRINRAYNSLFSSTRAPVRL